MPLSISIVTPSFNQSDFLKLCLDSVSGQSRKASQHIILDPGSTDGTRELLREYGQKFANVELIFEPDKGQADAISKGFALAQGDIVSWLNTDDGYSSPEVFEKIAGIFERHPDVDFVYGRGTFIAPD